MAKALVEAQEPGAARPSFEHDRRQPSSHKVLIETSGNQTQRG